MNMGNSVLVHRADGSVVGRAIPCRKVPRAVTFVFYDKKKKGVEVRRWGPAEVSHKAKENDWTFSPSFFVAKSVTLKDGEVIVALEHNYCDEWNCVVAVPFGDGWQKGVTEALMQRSRVTGSETHIANYDELIV